jgi:hypothetical protein
MFISVKNKYQETMIEMMVESISSSNNMHEVVNDNSNTYRNMVMDAM